MALTHAEEFWLSLRRTSAVVERHAEALVQQRVGVTLGMFMVLSALDAHPGEQNQSALATRLGLTKGTISRLLAGAAADGYVTAAVGSQSRRDRIVTLTELGRSIVARGDAALADSDMRRAMDEVPGLRRVTETLNVIGTLIERLDG